MWWGDGRFRWLLHACSRSDGVIQAGDVDGWCDGSLGGC